MARSEDPARCIHCEAPTAPGQDYCCVGCEVAHDLLASAGLDRYYDLKEGARLPQGALRPMGEAAPLTWLDPLLEASPAKGGVQRLTLGLQGIQCAACVWVIEQLFKGHAGGLFVEVNPGLGRMDIAFDPETFPLRAYLKDVAQLGYRAGPPRRVDEAPGDDLLLRFGIVAAIAMNSMIFSFSTYLGLTAEGDPGLFTAFGWANWVLSALAVGVGGQVFVRGSIRALRRGVLHLDVPIALGVVLAFAGSTWSFLASGGRAAYFDTLTLFIALMLLGRMLQRRVATVNRRRLLEDGGVEGLYVRILGPEGGVHTVSAGALEAGVRYCLAPGEVAPVLGRLMAAPEGEGDREGVCEGDVDPPPRWDFALDWMNGEPEPRPFGAGDSVPAGARNVSGRGVILTAEEGFQASNLRALLTPRRAQDEGDGLALSRFWDRLSRVYVALVLGLGSLGFFLWYGLLGGGLERSLEVTIAVLVVTCPCALGLATPLAYELALGALRRKGLFVTRVSLIDRALDVRKVIFDKTGTLTLGRLRLANPEALRSLPEEALAALGTLTSQSHHPRSRALFEALEGMGIRPRSGASVREIPGEGIRLPSGYALGRPRFVGDGGEAGGDEAGGDEGLGEETHFGRRGERLAAFRFEELLHQDARAEVAALQALGLKVYLFSGDGPARAEAAGVALGIPLGNIRGGLSPEDKARLITDMDRGDTLMVGDGINDALAFDAATVSGTPAIDRPTLPARADFFMMVQGAPPIAALLSVSKRTRRVIYRTLALAAAYNIVAVGLALGGVMSPLLCAIAMPLSSILSLALTARGMSARLLLTPGAEAATGCPLPARTSAPGALVA